MQCIKKESTLRLGAKGVKVCPRIVFRYGSQNGEVRNYLLYRRMIKDILKRGNDSIDAYYHNGYWRGGEHFEDH